MLHEFITANREEILTRCRARVATRSAPLPTLDEIDHGVPMFLDQVVEQLRLGPFPGAGISETATQHGHDLLHRGFTLAQVVHDYGDVCQAVTELAMTRNADFTPADFRVLNQCIDDAIAGAVTQYGLERDESLGGETAGDIESLGGRVRELRASIQTACGAVAAIYSGRVGVTGSTGTVLDRSLLRAHDLIDRVLSEVDLRRAPVGVGAVAAKRDLPGPARVASDAPAPPLGKGQWPTGTPRGDVTISRRAD
jgi:hypothetical protein